MSSCASAYTDQLLQEYWACPCTGSCPVGGPGCTADGRAIAPGGAEEKLWQATVPILSNQNGRECSLGSRHLPSARYRVAVRVFGTQAEAAAGSGGQLFERDFELVGGMTPQVVEIPVSLDERGDGGAGN